MSKFIQKFLTAIFMGCCLAGIWSNYKFIDGVIVWLFFMAIYINLPEVD